MSLLIKKKHEESSIEDSWTPDIENIIINIRSNCVILSDHHKNEYIHLKSFLKYFRIPTIVLSGINSVVSVGLQPYVEQQYISVMTCIISLICGIITSIELYLSIQSSLETELISSKEFHILALDIYKVISLDKSNRTIKGSIFLETIFNVYEKLIENSSVVESEIIDILNVAKLSSVIMRPPSPDSSGSMAISSLSLQRHKADNTYLKKIWPKSYGDSQRAATAISDRRPSIFNI